MMSPAPLAKSPNQLQGRKEIRPEDVVKPDLLNQILLVGSGAILILVTLLVGCALTDVVAL